MSETPPQYDVAHLHELLSQDPRTADPGIRVKIRGHDVFLQGRVSSTEVRLAAAEIVGGHLPGATVHNDLQVYNPGAAPRAAEELS